MIDPITALAGIQSAVALIKKVSKTVDDVSSLGPVLGKYFDAKNTAVKAAKQAKSSNKKSNMATAIEIEMALEQAAQFEKQLQLLFMQTGKIDVWNKIKKRSAAMDAEDARANLEAGRLARIKQQRMQEIVEIVLGSTLLLTILGGIGYGAYLLILYCNGQCGR